MWPPCENPDAAIPSCDEQNGKFEVKWKGFPKSTWEPKAELCARSPQLVDERRRQTTTTQQPITQFVSGGAAACAPAGKRAKLAEDLQVRAAVLVART